MDQRDSQATENIQDSAYEACSGRTDHKQISILRHGAENEYVRLACGVNLLFSVHEIASFYQSDNDFPQSNDTRRSSHPQKQVLHGVSFQLDHTLLDRSTSSVGKSSVQWPLLFSFRVSSKVHTQKLNLESG